MFCIAVLKWRCITMFYARYDISAQPFTRLILHLHKKGHK